MLDKKKIAVVIPAHNEELLISHVVETMPDYVDAMYVINDASTDGTAEKVRELMVGKNAKRLKLVTLEKNKGVGFAIARGYREALADKMDVLAVMPGDACTDPDDLAGLLQPVVDGKADYVKGNRLFTGEAWKIIPRYRYLGNATLSLLTKITSGYWHVADSQIGYTALSAETAAALPLEKLFPRYGYPNHLLALLNLNNSRVRDVPVRPIYDIGEKSGIRLWRDIPRISLLLIRNFFWRISQKYIIRDFHPLVFFYLLAFLLLGASVPLFVRMIYLWIQTANIPPINALAFMFTAITGLQSMFFAMWFDMEYNKDLK